MNLDLFYRQLFTKMSFPLGFLFILMFIVMIVTGKLAVYIAELKNLPKRNWFFLGFFGGPFVVFLIGFSDYLGPGKRIKGKKLEEPIIPQKIQESPAILESPNTKQTINETEINLKTEENQTSTELTNEIENEKVIENETKDKEINESIKQENPAPVYDKSVCTCCGKKVNPEKPFCPYCGANRFNLDIEKPICPNCKKKVNPNKPYCPYCGKKIKEN